MSAYPAGPPPPYPGPDGAASGGYPPGYPPAAPTYQEPPKGLQGYSDPTRPGGGYSQTGYAPQPQQYGGGYTHASTTVVVTQPTMAVVQMYREFSVRCQCPHCRAEVQTATYYETGTLTWVLCFVIFVVGCFMGCCLIPFCMDGAKDVVHTCPSCRQQIARYNRM